MNKMKYGFERIRVEKCVALVLLGCLVLPTNGFSSAASTKATSTQSVKVVSSQTADKDKAAKEKAAKEKAAKEKAAKEKAAKEKAAKEKAAKEKEAKELAAKEKADLEKAAAEPRAVIQHFNAKDGLEVTADYYKPYDHKTSDTLIIAFHQSKASRGEYNTIAPVLAKKHYAFLAVDQRSGQTMKGVDNETAALAATQKLPQEWGDAMADVEAAIEYGTTVLGYKKIVIWGSSYSTHLVLSSAVKYKDVVIGVVCFSAGDYVKTAPYDATQITAPTLFVTAPFETCYSDPIFESLRKNNTKNVNFVTSEDNIHGSSILWSGNYLPFSKEAWDKVLGFFSTLGIQTN